MSEPARPYTILVVDDEMPIVDLLEEVLADSGYQVVTATNGQEALAQLAQLSVDLVLSDVMMPLMDGPSLRAAMRAQPAYAQIPIIFMSAVRGFGVAPSDLRIDIAKPFNLDALLELIEQHLG